MEFDSIPNYQQDHTDSFDFKAFFFKLFRKWYLFAISLILAFSIAYIYNKFTIPIYEVSSTLLIKSSASEQQFIGMGFDNTQKNLQNEAGFIYSYGLVERTVKKLDFFVEYLEHDNFVEREVYHQSPFEVILSPGFPALRISFSTAA